MKQKKKIIGVLRLYSIGKYDTKTFCDIFTELFYFEKNGYLCFHGEEEKALIELAKVVERFSPFEEDLKNYPDVYTTEQQVRTKFEWVKKVFLL